MAKHLLMCEPIHYRIAYEINPWMRRSNAVVGPRAAEQWHRLHATLLGLGARIDLVEQGADVPDMTFTANAGIVIGRRFLLANFRFPERQPEAARFIAWFTQQGYAIERIHEPHYWEGEGDVLPADTGIFAGYRFRTEERALDHLDQLLGVRVVRLELADPRFYHLDTCLCPLDGGRALYYPPAFSEASLRVLRERIPDLIAVDDHDALRFACNALPVDGTVVLNSGCAATAAALEQRGLRCLSTPMDEFIKAGGSVKCLALTLDTFERFLPRQGGSAGGAHGENGA